MTEVTCPEWCTKTHDPERPYRTHETEAKGIASWDVFTRVSQFDSDRHGLSPAEIRLVAGRDDNIRATVISAETARDIAHMVENLVTASQADRRDLAAALRANAELIDSQKEKEAEAG